ncbi:MAG: stage II sporulation protein D [Clostridia bacterium]|nr:stage II sporulation protein D [Clostridia bacterium]
MKRNFTVCAILAAAMILIPLAAMKQGETKVVSDIDDPVTTDGYISVMKTENGKVEELDEREYLIGALAAEMDITCHDEALKAQVIACYTYVLYTRENGSSDDLNGADISDSPQTHQGYLNEEQRKKKWGEKFEEYEKKAGEIVDSVSGQAVYYEEKPIMAVYHDLNSGKTQSASTVWKKDVPYLIEVESPGDKLSTAYSSEVSFTYDEFEKMIKKIDGVTLDKDKEKWIGDVKKNGDYVESVEVCGNKISSVDFRTALDLKSCCFKINSDEDGITVETLGNGHLVGMSQYGADYMSRQGADYREILTHYYPGTKIQ